MPRLMDTEEVMAQNGPGAFKFSGVRIESLGATEYTLVTIVIDKSGSVTNFAAELLRMLKTVVSTCKKSPRAENLLIRILVFNQTITEIHGFRLLKDIDPDNDYQDFYCNGMTALYDATYDAVGATVDYSSRLVNDYEFDVNGIVFIATDGMNNQGSMTPKSIKDKIAAALTHEDIESLLTILIQMKDPHSPYSTEVEAHLKKFYEDAELSQYIDIGAATVDALAKLAQFVSQSVSSQSQSLGTGAPSQSLTF
jgi:uncharacterized protein YegL